MERLSSGGHSRALETLVPPARQNKIGLVIHFSENFDSKIIIIKKGLNELQEISCLFFFIFGILGQKCVKVNKLVTFKR